MCDVLKEKVSELKKCNLKNILHLLKDVTQSLTLLHPVIMKLHARTRKAIFMSDSQPNIDYKSDCSGCQKKTKPSVILLY